MLGLGLSITKAKPKAAKPVTPYQKWPEYPDSPVLTADYPHQCTVKRDSAPTPFLMLSTEPICAENRDGGEIHIASSGVFKGYYLSSGAWNYHTQYSGAFDVGGNARIDYANTDIYTDSSLTTVAFPKNV